MTEQDYMACLINLVGALAKKLTGETPMLCLQDSEGNITHFVPDTTQVTWLKDGEKWDCQLHNEQWFEHVFPVVQQQRRKTREDISTQCEMVIN